MSGKKISWAVKSGYCITKHHVNCGPKYLDIHENAVCNCDCHK